MALLILRIEIESSLSRYRLLCKPMRLGILHGLKFNKVLIVCLRNNVYVRLSLMNVSSSLHEILNAFQFSI